VGSDWFREDKTVDANRTARRVIVGDLPWHVYSRRSLAMIRKGDGAIRLLYAILQEQ
jgi:hypothetical protein